MFYWSLLNTTIVKTSNSYYIFTTIDGINLSWIALKCLFRNILNNLHGNWKPRKARQNTVYHSISGGKDSMIKILSCAMYAGESGIGGSCGAKRGKERHLGRWGLRFYYKWGNLKVSLLHPKSIIFELWLNKIYFIIRWKVWVNMCLQNYYS